ncbi:GcvT family protein [Roseovarius aestuarii]|uniref:4-methylaminobutanoate oxidase (Formaldehyde-forming) n=1 Tax=Roseovarius aestuarii TaxID=475083 RepID=A0A1X7BNM6_9RHOB|nr:FAD-dependent oxidoreductase [Roseovarius aestuarii]SMC11228.1 4-methylaminobutanoate oxidase (formaldehyde-forming) [Roseovarius aestuarii]
MPQSLPSHARIVVIGGGIVGCSTAYHLAAAGCKDVVVLEQYQLTAGSTWHAAGAVGQLRSDANVTRLLSESVKLYDELEDLTGQPSGWVRNGSLRLALTPERRTEYEIAQSVAHSFGVEFNMISPAEAAEMVPQMKVSDVLCAAFVPNDGVANPSDITQALAKGARNHGVEIIEGIRVTGCTTKNGTANGVETDQGTISCEIVVNCGGIWARELGRMAGVNVPLQPSHHQYFVTETIDGLARYIPSVRDPDKQTYFKEEVGGLAVGGYEFNPIPFHPDPIPSNHEFRLMEPNYDHFTPLLEGACERFPALEEVGVRQWFNGVEAFTEDGMFIMGEAPELRNYFVGAGFNAFGIAAGGGAGKALAHWVLNGEPPFDLWGADIRRFAPHHHSGRQVLARSLDGQAKHYKLHYPHEESTVCRGLRRSPVYDRLRQAGACFGGKYGWERPNWFAADGSEPKDEYRFGRQNWFPHVAEEHKACRERVAVFDQSSFAKFKLFGSDAVNVLQNICAANMAQEVGKIIYTPILNARGGIESDLTITRTAEDEYFVVTGTGSALRDASYIRSHIAPEQDARLMEVTSGYACLSAMGPQARALLSEIAENDLSDAAFPLGTARDIIVAGAPVTALRVAFVGELGWEIYIPSEFAVTVYDAIKEAGRSHGTADAGYRAIDSLRLEKARRLWGHEIGPDYTPLEAGLGFAVDMTKPDFIGREALMAQQARGVRRRLCTFTVNDPELVLYGKETIFRNGEQAGWLSSAGFGHSIGLPLGLGYVSCETSIAPGWIADGTYELEVLGKRVPAVAYLKPVYDPENKKLSA